MFKKLVFTLLLVVLLSQFAVPTGMQRTKYQVVVRQALRSKWRWITTTICIVMQARMLTIMAMATFV